MKNRIKTFLIDLHFYLFFLFVILILWVFLITIPILTRPNPTFRKEIITYENKTSDTVWVYTFN
jgi:hypothetical protein